MDKSKKLLEVFGDYLSANTCYEIFWSKLREQYFALTVDDEPAVFFEEYEALRRYIAGEFLHDMVFSDEFYKEHWEKDIGYRVVMAFKERMKPILKRFLNLRPSWKKSLSLRQTTEILTTS